MSGAHYHAEKCSRRRVCGGAQVDSSASSIAEVDILTVKHPISTLKKK